MTDIVDLSGKVVLVTGASRGIGAAIVRSVAEAGADVVVHCNQNRARAEALVESVKFFQNGPTVHNAEGREKVDMARHTGVSRDDLFMNQTGEQ